MSDTELSRLESDARRLHRPEECFVCGFPVFRKGGCAEWCMDVRRLNNATPNQYGSGNWKTAVSLGLVKL